MDEIRNGTFDFGASQTETAPGYYLFFDTETTGLPRDYKAPASRIDNWPRMIQIAWILFDKEGNVLDEKSEIIKPEGFEIPKDASDIHGITTERAMAEGRPLVEVLNEFTQVASQAEKLVAHNMSYDIKIIHAELLRKNIQFGIEKKQTICTKESSTNFCAIEGPYGFKWPRLSELYTKLFNAELEDAHDAMVDVNATAKCFWEMKKRGVL